jgi:hypothetical protein
MRKTLTCLVVAVLFGLGFADVKPAQAAARGRNPCIPEIEKYCKDARPGGGKIATCLKEHETDLSQECKDFLVDARERGREFAKNCGTDAKKLCKGVQPGGGRLIECLKEHEAEVSGSCKAYLIRTR